MTLNFFNLSNQTTSVNNFQSMTNERNQITSLFNSSHVFQNPIPHNLKLSRKDRRAIIRKNKKIEKRKNTNKVDYSILLANSWGTLKSGFSLPFNMGYNFCNRAYSILNRGVTSIDNLLTRIANIIPGAQASLTCSVSCDEDHHFGIPLLGIITHNELLDKFENLGVLGGGGDALVFKIRNKCSGKIYAMSIEYDMRRFNLYNRKKFFEQIFDIQNKNPHLAKSFAVFWLENKNYPFSGGAKDGISPYEKLKRGQFIRTDYEDDREAITYYREVIIKELGKGEVGSDEFKKFKTDPLILMIQMTFNKYLLNRYGICPIDGKLRNHVWKPVEGEYFNGKLLKEFNFWHYQFGSYHLYLPRPEFIVKRIDFSGWVLCNPSDDGRGWLESIAESEHLTIDDLFRRYQKPNVADSEILDMDIINDCT